MTDIRPPGRRKVLLFTLRAPRSLKGQLDGASERNQRSVSQEIESRLERSFVVEELEGGPRSARVLQQLAGAIAELDANEGRLWLTKPWAWSEVCRIARSVLESARPSTATSRPRVRTSLPEGQERVPVTVRTSAALKTKLDAAAVQSGRSLTREIEARLEQSFGQEAGGHTSPANTFTHLVGAMIRDLEIRTGKSWLDDDEPWSEVSRFVLA